MGLPQGHSDPKSAPEPPEFAKWQRGRKSVFCRCGTRLRGLERIRNSDLRTLRGRDRFSSPRCSESWDCHRVTRIRRAPRKRQSLQTGRGGANRQFASAVRCFLSGIESPGAAVPGTKGHRKVDLVERNASVPLKATETTLRNFCPSLHRKL